MLESSGPLPRLHRQRRRFLAFLPAALLLWFVAAQVSWAEYREEHSLGRGLTHIRIVRQVGPLEINALIAETAPGNWAPAVVHAQDHVAAVAPLSELVAQVEKAGAVVGGAVNADFFIIDPQPYRGDPVGLMIHKGELISLPSPKGRSAFGITPAGTFIIGVPTAHAWATFAGQTVPIDEVNGIRGLNSLALYTPTFGPSTNTGSEGTEVVVAGVNLPLVPGKRLSGTVKQVEFGGGNTPIPKECVVLSGHGTAAALLATLSLGQSVEIVVDLGPEWNQAVEAVGGGPRLVRDGKVSVEAAKESWEPAFATSTHPRSALGFSGSKLILATVDGRMPGYSAGVSLADMAQIMISLGAQQAINLDGGGSTTLVARDQVVNTPSGDAERGIADALLLFWPHPAGPPAELTISPESVSVLPGAKVSFSLKAKDAAGNPVDPGPLTWVVNPETVGQVDSKGNFVASTGPGGGLVKAFCKGSDAKAYAEVRLYAGAKRLTVEPAEAFLLPGEQLRLTPRLYSEHDEELLGDPQAFAWTVVRGSGVVDSQGVFTAREPGEAQVKVTYHLLSAACTIQVGGTLVPLEDFEKDFTWTGSSRPEWVPGCFIRSSRVAHSGTFSGRLIYDFTTTPATRAVGAMYDANIGNARAVSVWVYGDGQGHRLRGRYKDAGDRWALVDFASKVDWKGEWRQVTARIEWDQVTYPIRWDSFILLEADPQARNAGAIYLDDVRAVY